MKAAIYRRYGPPDVVQIADVPRPDLETKDVFVKVRATTVTAGDSRLRSANVPRGFGVMVRLGFGIFGPRKPILGSELAGEVAAVGQSVSRFAPGDKVFAARMGCHAEYVAVPEDDVAPMPGNLTFGEAAALTFGGLTTLFFLRDKARIQPRERVLINGASGAVGSAAVQLAKHFGAVVTGVCSAANCRLAVIVRLVWSCGFAMNTEPMPHASARAGAGAERLIDFAQRYGSVFLVGHGMMTMLIAKQLLALGWSGPKVRLNEYWRFSVYRFPG